MPKDWNREDNLAVRRLRKAIEEHPHDPGQSERDSRTLQEFLERFPPEKLGLLTLDDYAMGAGDKDSFSYWLEFGLKDLGRYFPGTSRGHFIYRQKDGTFYRTQDLQNLPVEEAMRRVAERHSQAVEDSASEDPEVRKQLGLKSDWRFSPGRLLKLATTYHPDKYLPINNPDHLESFLKMFGVPSDEVPDGPLDRNRLLMGLYRKIAQPSELTGLEFMRLIYDEDEFNPAAGIIRNRRRLKAAKRLFLWLYGEKGFQSQRYLERERNWKLQLSKDWRSKITPEAIDQAIAAGRALALHQELTQLLTGSSFLSWRYQGVLKNLDEEQARTFFGNHPVPARPGRRAGAGHHGLQRGCAASLPGAPGPGLGRRHFAQPPHFDALAELPGERILHPLRPFLPRTHSLDGDALDR